MNLELSLLYSEMKQNAPSLGWRGEGCEGSRDRSRLQQRLKNYGDAVLALEGSLTIIYRYISFHFLQNASLVPISLRVLLVRKLNLNHGLLFFNKTLRIFDVRRVQ